MGETRRLRTFLPCPGGKRFHPKQPFAARKRLTLTWLLAQRLVKGIQTFTSEQAARRHCPADTVLQLTEGSAGMSPPRKTYS
jgi:hypothetical protein